MNPGTSRHEQSSTLQQILIADYRKNPLTRTGKITESSQEKRKVVGHSFGQPYLDTKCESEQSMGTERVGPPKHSHSVQKPRLGINRSLDGDGDNFDDDNELVKYMSNLPAFLQHMEKGRSNVQDKALNFGVLDWKLLEKWKYNERMPTGKYPQKGSSSSSNIRIGRDPIKQSSFSHGSRFGSPKEERNVSHHHQGEKYVELVRSNRGKETCNREYRADHFHQRAKSYGETNVCSSKRKDLKKEILSKEETLQSNSYYAHGKRKVTRSGEIKLKPSHFERDESKTSLDDVQSAEMVGTRLSDFFYPQELKSGEINLSASESKHSLAHEENVSSPSSFLESSSDKNQQTEYAKTLAPKESPPSPTRRFSFHLGRMSKSLSFKDNSAVPQLSSEYTSIKSGPVRPKTSSGPDNNNKLKSDCSRARSSPLRRLLDPLLKHKVNHPAEPVSIGLSQDRKPERPTTTTLLALLQITLKNGLPFFKLVVNSSNEMLAATVKRLPVYGKTNSCMMYVFYSVHEVKTKKGISWINQGSKSNKKSCNLGYNIVGEMKISSSSECGSKECVLYCVENEPEKELAAVIVGKTGKQTEREENNMNDNGGTVVILPGGVHGLPNEGFLPSSLISRWRFGGSCDCGGWDIGCTLRVLVDCKKTSSHCLQSSEPSSSIDYINLYSEGGEKGSKPVFTMKPFSNGYYSIELDASISLLEAFATCVAHVTCLKFAELTDAKSSGSQYLPEALLAEADKRKTTTVTCPPLSPAGRI
ncbi:Protein of unknown function (DUF3527 [Striga hermonthica]|uniref:Uncharacterized protein n=1 Tax=Striga hermonthica TaxID=68872 RepID=A0A9N7RLW5_STRHE|nr:Protein of unknown function (DUF3527 [Striga hermonthica]